MHGFTTFPLSLEQPVAYVYVLAWDSGIDFCPLYEHYILVAYISHVSFKEHFQGFLMFGG